jgi:excisionase family DNA binding protein
MSQDDRLLLTIPEAARTLGISVSHGYVLARTGVLPIVRIGRLVRVSRRTLAAWCEGLETDRPVSGRS